MAHFTRLYAGESVYVAADGRVYPAWHTDCLGCGLSWAHAVATGQLAGWRREPPDRSWCPACWRVPPDLAALLRAFAAADLPTGQLADWLEEHGDARTGLVRTLRPGKVCGFRRERDAVADDLPGVWLHRAVPWERPETPDEFRRRVLALFPRHGWAPEPDHGRPAVPGRYVCERCGWHFPDTPDTYRRCPACGTEFVRKLREGEAPAEVTPPAARPG